MKTAGQVVGIIVGIATILGLFTGYFNGELSQVHKRVDGVEQVLGAHKDNMAIHRTSQEARVYQQAEEDRWNQLFRELNQINKRIDNIERRIK